MQLSGITEAEAEKNRRKQESGGILTLLFLSVNVCLLFATVILNVIINMDQKSSQNIKL